MSELANSNSGPSRKQDTGSYGQILHATALIGASYIVVMVLSLVRMKVLALLLGPEGVGLIGLFATILDMATAVASLGTQSSGVRQIADATGRGDGASIAATVAALFWTSLALGIAGAIGLVALSLPLSNLTFGSPIYAVGIAALSAVVFLRMVSGAQLSLLQGMRRIGDLARINILSALVTTCVTVASIYAWGEAGIVPSLILAAIGSLTVSWWYRRKIVLETTPSPSEVRREIAPMVHLGLAFMASGLLTAGAAYVIRILVTHSSGVHAAGLYQAAWTVAGLYAGFVLQAMGTDFYPRLTGVASDNVACNRMVNEQARVSMLLAGPGMIATVTLAPLVLTGFYSSEFETASLALRWICLGITLRVVAWPLGYIVLAKGAQRIFFWTELAATIVHVGLAYALIPWFGVEGAGLAFFGLYLWHSVLIYFVVRSLSGFRWTNDNRIFGVLYLAATGCAFLSFFILPFWPATIFGLTLTCIAGFYALWVLLFMISPETLPAILRPLLMRLTARARSVG